MTDYIDLKKLTLDELTGVVHLYPWYGAARKELSVRMAQLGGDTWVKAQYGEAALYVGDRAGIAALFRPAGEDYSDKDVEALLRAFIEEREKAVTEEAAPQRQVRVVGGDFFTQAQYDDVRMSSDNVFSRFAAKGVSEPAASKPERDASLDFCTETLARVYAEQGYPEQAKNIYSRLLLNFPEKSAYFASLIEKLNEE